MNEEILRSILEEHEVRWGAPGRIFSTENAQGYSGIQTNKPGITISIYGTGIRECPDWYYRVFLNHVLRCTNSHFMTAADTLRAALAWCDHTGTPRLRIRLINPWSEQKAFTIDGLLGTDVSIVEYPDGVWRTQAIEDDRNYLWSESSWPSPEAAFAAYQDSKLN